MKIWFDISNAPHINLFKDLLKELESEGHKIVVTCRPLSNTISLLNLHNIKYTIIGRHYGKNIFKKIIGYPIRIWQLKNYLSSLKVDVAISQSSFHSPVVARLLGIPSIYMNDNEHALGNIPSFICATRIMIPEFLNIKKAQRQGARCKKIVSYPGVKEGIYLWRKYLTSNVNNTSPPIKLKIYIRPEPRTAQYYKGGENFLDDVIINLKDRFPVILLTRDKEQYDHYKRSNFAGIEVPEYSIFLEEIVRDCQLFIGAGGTMTREMAVIGIPTISVYRDSLLDVDEYLIKMGLMNHIPDLKIENVLSYIEMKSSKLPDKHLLSKGRITYDLIKSSILEITK